MGWEWGILSASGAGAAGAYEHIASTILSASQTTVTFSSIASTYKHLQLRAVARSTRAANNRTLVRMRLNGDTGSNYAYHSLTGNGTSVSTDAASSAAFMQMIYFIPDNDSGLANNFGAAVFDILDYASSSKNTTVRALGGNNSRFNSDISLDSGLWNNTAAVTSISLYPANGFDFAIGSRFSLYGIKG